MNAKKQVWLMKNQCRAAGGFSEDSRPHGGHVWAVRCRATDTKWDAMSVNIWPEFYWCDGLEVEAK